MTVKHSAILFCLTSLFIINSCSDTDSTYDFPRSPYIDSPSMLFIENEEANVVDSMVLSFRIFDKERDLGIGHWERDTPPFHQFDPIFDSQDRWVTYGDNDVEPPFFIINQLSERVKISDIDNRPDFSCENYMHASLDENFELLLRNLSPYFTYPAEEVVIDGILYHPDTVFVLRNENFFNIYVEWYRLNGQNEELIDWKYLMHEHGCFSDFSGIFPYVYALQLFQSYTQQPSPFEITRTSIYGYDVKFNMTSIGFRHVLRDDKFKLKILIKDREFNESNVLETEYMTLDEMMSVN